MELKFKTLTKVSQIRILKKINYNRRMISKSKMLKPLQRNKMLLSNKIQRALKLRK